MVKVTYALSPQAKGKVEKVDIRIIPDEKNGVSVLRFWYNRKIIDVKRVKNTALEGTRFLSLISVQNSIFNSCLADKTTRKEVSG